MEIAIAGAHGKIARRLTRLLVERGDSVRALIRNPGHAADVEADGAAAVVCDLETAGAEQVAAALGGAEAVVFAAGAGPGSGSERKGTMDRDGAILLVEAARAAGAERYVMVSSIGAESPPDDDDVFSAYLRAKADADRALMASDRAWTVVRPVSLTDDPGDGCARIDPEPLRGRVSRDDVAATLAAVLAEPRAAGRILYVAAGEEPIAAALAAALAG
jgi:uncharacterized protein YbjT (DUF2867 family)